MRIIKIWKGVEFSDAWRNADTSKLDDIAPSWYKKRRMLQSDSREYEEFITRLKRRHAIETGIIERLYELRDGVAETFIREGFIESYLQHGDTNVASSLLFAYLNDQFEAVEFVYEVFREDRSLTKGFILELHALLTRHQDTCEAVDSLGIRFQAKLTKGAFKKLENNPRRADAEKYVYCPPEQVDTEIERLLALHDENAGAVSPVILASWFHHQFTTIHPFQDGNGRMARLLASLVLIKNGLFPLTVGSKDKPAYIDGLRAADEGDPVPAVEFFCETQRRSIEQVLNLQVDESGATLEELAREFADRVNGWKAAQARARDAQLVENRAALFEMTGQRIHAIRHSLHRTVDQATVSIGLAAVGPDDATRNHGFTSQIAEYARTHEYFFNKSLPRGWLSLRFKLSEEVEYSLIVTLHHYGYGDSTMAIGGMLEFKDLSSGEKTYTPMPVPPYTVSLERSDMRGASNNLAAHVEHLASVALATIMSEIER
jgi:Fic family protein